MRSYGFRSEFWESNFQNGMPIWVGYSSVRGEFDKPNYAWANQIPYT